MAILSHLKEGDQFGLATFESSTKSHNQNSNFIAGQVVTPLQPVTPQYLNQVKLALPPRTKGSTNFESGYKVCRHMFPKRIDPDTTENRILVLTDDQPNTGNTDPKTCVVCITYILLSKNIRNE